MPEAASVLQLGLRGGDHLHAPAHPELVKPRANMQLALSSRLPQVQAHMQQAATSVRRAPPRRAASARARRPDQARPPPAPAPARPRDRAPPPAPPRARGSPGGRTRPPRTAGPPAAAARRPGSSLHAHRSAVSPGAAHKGLSLQPMAARSQTLSTDTTTILPLPTGGNGVQPA